MNRDSHLMNTEQKARQRSNPMEHSYIDEHNIVARYGMGKLSPEECTLFEEHLVDCVHCQEQLETTQEFSQAFKRVAAEDRLESQFGTNRTSSFRVNFFWRPALIAAAACVIIFAVPGFFLMRQARLAQAELSRANAAAENWRHQYLAEHQASTELDKRLHEPGQTAKPDRSASAAPAAVPAAAPVAAMIFTLESVRGGDQDDDTPVNQMVIPRSAQSVVLTMNREDLEELRSYHLTVSDSHGHVLAELNNLETSAGISVPANLLHVGDYRLILEGRSRQGNNSITRTYPFRIKSK